MLNFTKNVRRNAIFSLLFALFSFSLWSQTVVNVPIETRVVDVRNLLWSKVKSVDGFNATSFNFNIKGNRIDAYVRGKKRFKKRILFVKFKCTVDASLTIKADVNLQNDLRVNLNYLSGSKVKLHKVCGSRLLASIGNFFRKKLFKIFKRKVNDALNGSLRNKAIEKINKLVAPRNLGSNVWLAINPKTIIYTNLTERDGILKLGVGAQANPAVTYGKPSTSSSFSFRKVNSIQPKSSLAAKLSVPFSSISNKANSLLKPLNDKLKQLGYSTSVSSGRSGKEVRVTLTVNKRIRKRRWFRKYWVTRKMIDINFFVRPSVNTSNLDVFISSARFTTSKDNDNVMGKVTSIVNSVVNTLRASIKYNLKSQKAKIDSKIKKFAYNANGVKVSAKFNPIKVSNFYLNNTEFAINARTSGSLKINLKLKRQAADTHLLAKPLTQELPECIDCDNSYDTDLTVTDDNIIDAQGNIVASLKANEQELEQTSTFIKVYPNPTTSVINITSPNTVKEVIVYNTTGAIVGKYTNLTTINVEAFAKGMYFAEVIDTNDNHEVVKFIKK